jgi:hypothetical protein
VEGRWFVRIGIAVIVGASIGLGMGLGLGIALRDGGPDDAVGVSQGERALAQAELENETLRRRIEQLEARLAAAAEASASEPTMAAAAPAAAEREASPAEDTEAVSPEVEAELEANVAASTFDEARLEALGFHPSDIERLRTTWEAIELEKLYIQNERARSDTRDGRYWARIVALEREAIADLGEEDYDALLYASGAANRVRVRSVLPGSPAEAAGLGPGDEIIGYDEEPIFRPGAVKQGTIGCEPNRSVALRVLQDGVDRRVWVPCGPLGVHLDRVKAEPR